MKFDFIFDLFEFNRNTDYDESYVAKDSFVDIYTNVTDKCNSKIKYSFYMFVQFLSISNQQIHLIIVNPREGDERRERDMYPLLLYFMVSNSRKQRYRLKATPD